MDEVVVLFSNADYQGVVNHESARKLLTIPWKLPANTKQGWYSHVITIIISTCAQAKVNNARLESQCSMCRTGAVTCANIRYIPLSYL